METKKDTTMKRVNYIIALAACLAALLTSCIKEEQYTLDTLDLQVNVTRAGATSEQQGDKIEDIMIWAFPITNGVIADNAEGWRTYKPSSDTYTSVSVHIPLPMCNGEAKDYRLVAVINKDKFGKIINPDGSTLTLDQNSTYPQLIKARFESQVVNEALNKDEWNTPIEDLTPGAPAAMPVSHWKDVKVTDANVHPNSCLQVDMPVFRALAKTQLFVARNNQFEATFPLVRVINAAAENQGAVLAEPATGWSVIGGVDMPDWFDGLPTLTNNAYDNAVVNAYIGGILYDIGPKIPITDPNFVYDDNSALISAKDGRDVAHYICGNILYETTASCTYNDPTYKSVPTGSGYYYAITYRISTTGIEGDTGEMVTRYVPLPPIVRNHDYQVRAFIKEDGGIEVSYTVADWEDHDEWNLAFDAAQHTSLLPKPDENEKPTEVPTISYTGDNLENGAAVFFFKMSGPEGITWKPTLKANASDFEARVYKVTSINNDGTYTLDNTPIEGDIVADKDTFYAIKVVALHFGAMDMQTISDRNPLELIITHAPQWNDEMDNSLIINPNNGDESSPNYFWPMKTADGVTHASGDQATVKIYPETVTD